MWFDEVWNKGRADAIDELFAKDCIAYGLGDGEVKGPEAFKAFQAQFCGAFPDLKIKVEEIVSEGDLTASRISGTGTHTGDQLGVAPTGIAVTFTGMTFTRWKDGQIVEGWNNVDVVGILKQIGAA